MNNNFKWLVNDIYDSIILKLYYNDNGNDVLCGSFEVFDFLDVVGDELDIEFANIDDITKMLTMGIVRFVNVDESSDIIDIPFRNMYKLYKNSNKLEDISTSYNRVSLDELECFSIFDGASISQGQGYFINGYLVSNQSEDLDSVMMIASNFGSLGMQEKFDALAKVNLVNYNRVRSDNKNK